MAWHYWAFYDSWGTRCQENCRLHWQTKERAESTQPEKGFERRTSNRLTSLASKLKYRPMVLKSKLTALSYVH